MGRQALHWNDGFRGFCATAMWDLFEAVTVRAILLAGFVTLTRAAMAFEDVPWEGAKSIGVTRGKQFSAGLVFINGKYIDPPYVVERWGTGIRINSMPVTGQIIDWVDFLKTQDPANVTKIMPEPNASATAQTCTLPVVVDAVSDVDALDDLFDDDPAPKKSAWNSSYQQCQTVPARPKPATPKYVLTGKFVKNEASKSLVKRINDQRTEIDGILRRGGFIFFGDGYSRVAGDARTADTMLGSLPELMQHSPDVNAFRSGIRSAHMVYINEILAAQIFANRIDYRRLQDRRQKIKKEREWSNLLNDVSKPLL